MNFKDSLHIFTLKDTQITFDDTQFVCFTCSNNLRPKFIQAFCAD